MGEQERKRMKISWSYCKWVYDEEDFKELGSTMGEQERKRMKIKLVLL
jgi:hypothetical protein